MESDDDCGDRDDRYPLQPVFCVLCDIPPEYCAYGPNKKKCPNAVATAVANTGV